MSHLLLIPVLLTLMVQANAQDSPVLTNTGDPMRVPFTCAEDDLQFVGMFCTEAEPCAVYLELSAVVPDGRKILVSGNIHSSTGTINSILLMSEDGGSTWKEPAARIRGSALDQLQFYDLQHGWAAGETQYPLSRDPFFLVTSDGGASWRQRPVTDDGGPGTVQSFWFDSAQHGELVVDAGRTSSGGRYISYESQTGGESWMVRSTVNQLPRIKGAPGQSTDLALRLQAGKDGKAWQIEKRDGAQWSPLATFLIETASCGAPAVPDKERREPQ
jgi:photosystem II stability/assembly factor-like uncharacterized protein